MIVGKVTSNIIVQQLKWKIIMLMIDRKKLFDQPIKNDLKTYDNIRKIATNQDDDYATECLLDCPYFKNTMNWLQQI